MHFKQQFIDVLKTADNVPAPLAAGAANVRHVEESRFDESYIEFLDTMIRLSPRGPEWTALLKVRRAALSPYCNVPLIKGRIGEPGFDFWVYVDPAKRRVVYWEDLNSDA